MGTASGKVPMATPTLDNGLPIRPTVTVFMSGITATDMKVNGSIASDMVKGLILLQMVIYTWVSTAMVKPTAMDNTDGKTETLTLEFSSMV